MEWGVERDPRIKAKWGQVEGGRLKSFSGEV